MQCHEPNDGVHPRANRLQRAARVGWNDVLGMLHCLFIVSESDCRCALLGRFGDDVKRPRGGLRA